MIPVEENEAKLERDASGSQVLIFKPSEWAPGLWAGSEGSTLTYRGVAYRIKTVNLFARVLRITEISGAV